MNKGQIIANALEFMSANQPELTREAYVEWRTRVAADLRKLRDALDKQDAHLKGKADGS